MSRVAYSLPEEQCERLRRPEMMAFRMLLALLSTSSYAKEDLEQRLECIPNGVKRFRLAHAQLSAICNDLIGTISAAQARQIYGTMKDFEIRLVPKLTPGSTNVIFTKDECKELMDVAREKCHACAEDGESCRECRLYKLMTAMVPLDDYNTLICPYSMTDWED